MTGIMEILNFVPKTYYEIEGNFKSKNGEYKGKYIKGKEIKFDDEKSADLVIVGAGAAGLSAALEAVNNGAEKVIILEATNKTGGSLNFTSGSMSAAETIIQKEDGIEDTLESFVEDIMNTGSDFGGKPNREMIEIFVEEDKDAFQWLWDNGLSEYEFTKDQQRKSCSFCS